MGDGHVVQVKVRHSDSLASVVEQIATAMGAPAHNIQCCYKGQKVLPMVDHVSFGMCGIPWTAKLTVTVVPGWGKKGGADVAPHYTASVERWADATEANLYSSADEHDQRIQSLSSALGKAYKAYQHAMDAADDGTGQEPSREFEALRCLQLEVTAAIEAKKEWRKDRG